MGHGDLLPKFAAARPWWFKGVLLAVGLVGGSSVAGLRASMSTPAAATSSAEAGETTRRQPSASGKYRFELVGDHIRAGGGAVLTLRLLDRRTGKLVPDAIVFISRIDMGPDGMGDMDAALDALPDTLPGYYRFETDLLMTGDWALTIAAKVPGDDAMVLSRLRLTVVP